jgi:DNA-binding phage protein
MGATQPGNQRNEPDDIEAYIATFDEEEHRELVAAEAAIDIAVLLNRARRQRGLSQTAAAELTGMKQQAISRIERPDANPRLETVQAYLSALGFALELKAIDVETGDVAATVILPPAAASPRRRDGEGGAQSPAPNRTR